MCGGKDSKQAIQTEDIVATFIEDAVGGLVSDIKGVIGWLLQPKMILVWIIAECLYSAEIGMSFGLGKYPILLLIRNLLCSWGIGSVLMWAYNWLFSDKS